jgi:hypothetical protein
MNIERLERRVLLVLYGPDVSFADGGVADGVHGDIELAVLASGKVLAVGATEHNSGGFDEQSTFTTAAQRLNADGTIDPSFATNGTLDLGGGVVGSVVSGSRLYVLVHGGDEDTSFTTLRAYTVDGQVDQAFHSSQQVAAAYLVAASDGGVFVSGESELKKYKPDGTLDASFVGDGVFTKPEAIESIAVTSGGIITVHDFGAEFVLKRYRVDTGHSIRPSAPAARSACRRRGHWSTCSCSNRAAGRSSSCRRLTWMPIRSRA